MNDSALAEQLPSGREPDGQVLHIDQLRLSGNGQNAVSGFWFGVSDLIAAMDYEITYNGQPFPFCDAARACRPAALLYRDVAEQ